MIHKLWFVLVFGKVLLGVLRAVVHLRRQTGCSFSTRHFTINPPKFRAYMRTNIFVWLCFLLHRIKLIHARLPVGPF